MKKPVSYTLLILFVVIAMGIGALLLNGATPDQPQMGALSALPTVIATNHSTVVTFLIPLPDATVISTGVNLLRTTSNGQQTIVGQFHDDGQAGDLAPNDGIYGIRLTLSEPLPTQLVFQVSAAFRGRLTRVLSSAVTIRVTSDGTAPLPPDPGSTDKQTLVGIDSDKDGVRDDVQRYIVSTYPQSAKWRSALTQVTLAIQSEVLAPSSALLSKATDRQSSYALDCLNSVFMTSDADVAGGKAALDAYKSLQGLILNTPDRAKAFLQADSQLGAVVTFSSPYSLKSSRCLLDLSTLPN